MAIAKQRASAMPAIIMGFVFIGMGLLGNLWLLWSLGQAVTGARDGSGYSLLVFFAVILSPACIVTGVLALVGGYRQRHADLSDT